MIEAPTLRTPEPKKAGLWPVWLGALLLFTFLKLLWEGDSAVGLLLIGGGLFYWGVNRRWLVPRRIQREEQETYRVVLGDPERQLRLSGYQDGSWVESVKHRDEFLTASCTWYTPTPAGKVKERDAGTLTLNAKGLRLSGAARSLEVPFGRIVAVTAKRDALVVEKLTGPHLIIAVEDPIDVALACQAISEARAAGKL